MAVTEDTFDKARDISSDSYKEETEIPTKPKRNKDTPTKRLQKNYWDLYITECDISENPDMQIKEAVPQHYQNVSIQKNGIQILQTINTLSNYVASEIAINNNKELFNKLFKNKTNIEKEIGKLQWDSKDTNKSAKIRKIFSIDINNSKNHKKAILELTHSIFNKKNMQKVN